MTKIEFLSCKDDGGGHFVVQRRITDDSGVAHEGVHIFPYDTLEWRAAEYDIDPSDVDTLLDIVLAEPYLTSADYAGACLYDGQSTVEDARAAHITRCAKVKLGHRMSTRARSADPLRIVRESHLMHPEALEVKRELVNQGRESQRRARAAKQQEPDRVTQLRNELAQLRKRSDHDAS